jgi:serine/threonine-protein kinase HipA
MLKVWADGAEAGLLDRYRERGGTFAYLPDIPAIRAVSATMPVRLPSWDVSFGLPPIFEMNLPEGFLRERLRLAFAKAAGSFDEFDLLGIVGRSQVGRIRYTGRNDGLLDEVPFQSIHEILAHQRDGELFRFLLEKFAVFSGISGVQPKILVRDEGAFPDGAASGERLAQSFRGATHIVKFWEPNEYPQLAANEYFCLTAARRCGLEVPPFRLAEDGAALIIDRFDLRMNGTYRGFEDFCVLNARRTDEKYRGTYETHVMKRFAQFASGTYLSQDLESLFVLIALNCGLRNGDAHLKNFGIVYDDVEGEARLAPVYDVVTTAVYLRNDSLALTLNGSTRWPQRQDLQRLAETRCGLSPARASQLLDRVATGIQETRPEVRTYAAAHPAFRDVGRRMLEEWGGGVRDLAG